MDTSPADALEPRHPIAIVAERTGLSQDVIRVWERRYSAVEPSRGPGGRRLYSDADIERLRLMHATARAGRSISQVAAMSTVELARLAAQDDAARSQPPGNSAPAADGVIAAALLWTQELNGVRLGDELRRAAAARGLTGFIETVAVPLMRAVGDEWHAGQLSIAGEHLASAILLGQLLDVMRSFTPPHGAPRMLVATPAGERHAIGAAITGATSAADGWDVIYLGVDMPAAEIVAAALSSGVEVVALSVVYAEQRGRLLKELAQVRRGVGEDVRVVVGGAGARAMAPSLRALGIDVATRVQRMGG